MNLREAAKMALEALETEPGSFADWLRTMKAARTALRSALAEEAMQRLADVQQEMEATIKDNLTVEPVAWISEVVCVGPNLGVKRYDKLPIQSLQPGFYKHTPLYDAPPKRKPLTDDEIHDCFQQKHKDKTTERRMIARAIERAHGIGGEE